MNFSDYQGLLMMISLLCGAIGGVSGVIVHLWSRPDALAKGRRYVAGVLNGVFAAVLVFTMLGSKQIPPLQEIVVASAFFSVLLGLGGGMIGGISVENSLEKQALLRKIDECHARADAFRAAVHERLRKS